MYNISNAYVEVYAILQDLEEDAYNKIPPEIIQTIKNNRNKQYNFELDENLELKEHHILPETKAILFNIFRDYLATPEQKSKIISMQNEERRVNEIKKQQQYGTDVFKSKKKTDELKQEKVEIIKYKENIFSKIKNKIIKVFLKK